jgi:hypothetical protein
MYNNYYSTVEWYVNDGLERTKMDQIKEQFIQL